MILVDARANMLITLDHQLSLYLTLTVSDGKSPMQAAETFMALSCCNPKFPAQF
jgi:hypothetical protein